MAIPILIADDSAMSRRLIRRALPDNWDIEITEAENGIEALAAHEEGKAKIIFLDLTMPKKDGFEVLESLRDCQSDSQVIVVSADIQSGAQEKTKKLGALAFVKKPVNPDEIQGVLQELGLWS